MATETGDYIGLNNSSVLENAGTLNLTDGFEIFSNDTTANQLENDASGTINYTSTAAASTQISVAMVNAGMLTLGGNSTLDVNGPSFDNSGTGTVNAGGTTTFSAEAGNSVSNVDAGTYSVASGAAVDFAGTRRIGAATFTGTGPVHVSASLDVADPVSIPNLQLDSGSLAGPATLAVTGTLGLNGTNSNALTGAHLINKGVATETGDYIGLNNSSVLENAGTLNLTDGFEIFSNDTTANQLENDASGTINYTSTAAASTQISVAMVNAGMLTLGGNSTLDVNGPSFDNSGTGTVNAGGATTFSAEAGTPSPTWMPGPTAWPVAPQWTSRGDTHDRGGNVHRHRSRPRQRQPGRRRPRQHSQSAAR